MGTRGFLDGYVGKIFPPIFVPGCSCVSILSCEALLRNALCPSTFLLGVSPLFNFLIQWDWVACSRSEIVSYYTMQLKHGILVSNG